MRQILMTVLLIVAVVGVYLGFNGGSDGAESKLRDSATRMADGISRISP
ncbi:hypothetical protein [Cohnella sp. AR92]|nr:hypothetical protein [Cohnella sp. AR92]